MLHLTLIIGRVVRVTRGVANIQLKLIPQTPSDVIFVYARLSAGGLRWRRERQPMLRTSRPATLAQRVRGAEGGSTRVVLLQLRLDIRAPTQGIFQYNNVLGSHASPGRGNTDVRQYFYNVYVKSAESRSIRASHG
jgi:hypothetical protein